MILEKDLSKVLSRLSYDNKIQVHSGGSDIDVRLLDRNTKISLVTTVYEGGNFVPMSVRKCLIGKAPFGGAWLHTDVKLDESHFQVLLTYTGEIRLSDSQSIKDLLIEFSWQAEEWRLYLEEHDKHDLVHVYVK